MVNSEIANIAAQAISPDTAGLIFGMLIGVGGIVGFLLLMFAKFAFSK
jgi:hypothetical protein